MNKWVKCLKVLLSICDNCKLVDISIITVFITSINFIFKIKNCCWVKHSKQGVVFVQNPANFQAGMDVKYRVVFQPESCQLLFQLPGNN